MPNETIIAHTPGVCPLCDNRAADRTTPDYFDNPEDEMTFCYQCGRHAINPRWHEITRPRTPDAPWHKSLRTADEHDHDRSL